MAFGDFRGYNQWVSQRLRRQLRAVPMTVARRLARQRRRKGMLTYSKGMLLKRPSYNMYNYKQAVDGASVSVGFSGTRIITQSNAFQASGIVCTLADCAQAATFTSLYDQYRINKIVIKIQPMCNINGLIQSTYAPAGSAITGANSVPGLFYTIIDTDGNAATSLSTMEQYSSFKSYPVISNRPIKIVAVPGVDISVQHAGGANVAAVCKKKQWLDCGDATINHFVGGWGVDSYGAGGVSTAQTWSVQCYYYLSFRNVR